MKLLTHLLLVVFLACSINAVEAQVPDTLSLDLRASADGEALELYVRSHGVTFSETVQGLFFAIKWPIGSSASLGASQSFCSDQMDFEVINYWPIPDYNIIWFAGGNNLTPLCSTETWIADQWRMVYRVEVEDLTEVTLFQLHIHYGFSQEGVAPTVFLNDGPDQFSYALPGIGFDKVLLIANGSVSLGSGTSNDCAGVQGGNAFIDECGQCVAGSTGITPNSSCADCVGVPNGTSILGSFCNDNDTSTTNDIWTANCTCVGTPVVIAECEADLYVMQAYESGGGDPIPFTLWVWNLSTADDPVNEYVWDFGDGTTSTDPFPTHTYSGTGPYILCLSMYTNGNCTDTYCDTVSVDDDGFYQGMIGSGDARSVLTVNVQQGSPLDISEITNNDVAIWPNPASEFLNITIDKMNGGVHVSITEINGRLVRTIDDSNTNSSGMIRMQIGDLSPGLYMVNIQSEGGSTTTQYLMKQ